MIRILRPGGHYGHVMRRPQACWSMAQPRSDPVALPFYDRVKRWEYYVIQAKTVIREVGSLGNSRHGALSRKKELRSLPCWE